MRRGADAITTNLPYVFQEGQKAYANQLMADLYAILGAINDIMLSGETTGKDLATILQEHADDIAARVVKNQAGNAAQILFSDGESFQQKLDSGDFNGVDALSVMNHMYKMFVDPANGHLYIAIPDGSAPPPLSIDNNGHLIYTVSEETDLNDAILYDLGNVRGLKGDDGAAGGMQASVYDTNNRATDIFTYVDGKTAIQTASVTAAAASWDSVSKELTISCSYVTANNNFDVDTAANVTDVQQAAWMAAKPKIVDQDTGTFTMKAFGEAPEVDIPLIVRVYG